MGIHKKRPGIDDFIPGDIQEYIDNHQREVAKLEGKELPEPERKPFSYRIERILRGLYRVTAWDNREYFIQRDRNRGRVIGWEWHSALFQTPYEREGGFGQFKLCRDHLIKRLTERYNSL